MPVQQQVSLFGPGLAARAARANAKVAGTPINLRGKQLRANIHDGTARLSAMYCKVQEKDDGACPKGQTFFRASAVVLSPEDCAGAVTQILIPMCDMPDKEYEGKVRKGRTLEENWDTFRSLMEALGVDPFPEKLADTASDAEAQAHGTRLQNYFFSAMTALVANKQRPVFISFSTRGFKPAKKPTESQADYDKKEPMVMEDWHGKAVAPPRPDPAAGVGSAPPSQPPTSVAPPPSTNGTSPPPAPTSTVAPQADLRADMQEVVGELIEVAMGDPDGATDEGTQAITELIRLAHGAGWTSEQTDAAKDWADVGRMALEPPQDGSAHHRETVAAANAAQNGTPAVGSRWGYAKRKADGTKLQVAGKDVAAKDVEVLAVDEAARTCTAKYVKDGEPVVDFKKRAVTIKFEWLEPTQPY